MQANLPDDPLVRETMTSLGPGAKDATLDDLVTWIRRLEELCKSKDATLASASFRTDISGSCLSKLATTGPTTKLQTKTVKGYPPLPELHMEIVSSQKKNARGEAKLRLSVESGPVLVLLTITDLHGATRTLRVVMEDDKDLIPIKHPATTIEATAIPFTPDQLLEQLRLLEAKIKEQRGVHIQPSASPQRSVEEGSAQRQADGVEYMKMRSGPCIIEQTIDRETGTVTIKSSACPDVLQKMMGSDAAPSPVTLVVKNGKVEIEGDDPQMKAVLAPILKSILDSPQRVSVLSRRVATTVKEENAILEKLPTAKPAEKQRLLKELESKNAEFEKLTDLLERNAAGGWLGAPREQLVALLEKAKRKDPKRAEAARSRAHAALEEYVAIEEKLKSTSNPTRKKRMSKLLVRKGIDFDAAMEDIAVIAGASEQDGSKESNDVSTSINESSTIHASGRFGVPKEELHAMLVKAIQKDPVRVAPLASRALTALDEFTAIEEKLKSTLNPTSKEQLSALLGRKKAEVDGALNEIVVIVGGSKELNDVVTRMNEALVLDHSP